MGLPRIDNADGVVDGVNRVFAVPNPYVPGTLVAIVNGRQLDEDLENGWAELDPAAGTFELKVAPSAPQTAPDDPGDLVSAYYENALEPAGGGLEGGVPEICCGRDVRPKICVADEIVPGLESEGDAEGVPIVGAGEIRPKICETGDIRPRIESAEEV